MKKFTLLELLVVIAVIGILVTILLPSLREARVKAKEAVCLSNLNQLGVGSHIWSKSWNHLLPFHFRNMSTSSSDRWPHLFRGDVLKQIDLPKEIWMCPFRQRYQEGGWHTDGSYHDFDIRDMKIGYNYLGGNVKDFERDTFRKQKTPFVNTPASSFRPNEIFQDEDRIAFTLYDDNSSERLLFVDYITSNISTGDIISSHLNNSSGQLFLDGSVKLKKKIEVQFGNGNFINSSFNAHY